MTSGSEDSTTPPNGEKGLTSNIEHVKTNERVPGHPDYYEKGGLRTYGDDQDHDHEPPVRVFTERSVLENEYDGPY